MSFKALSGLLLIVLSQSATVLHAEVLEVAPSKDNSLYEDDSGRFSNGAGNNIFMGKVGGDGDYKLRRALVAFDVTAIPANAVVNSVEVRFTINKIPSEATADNAALHLLVNDWGEGNSDAPGNEGTGASAQSGDATWLHRFFDEVNPVFWGAPGGDFDSIASAETPFATSDPETITFESTSRLVTDVQAWIRNPAANFGWMLRGDESTQTNARRLASRESTFPPGPLLTIDYSVPSVTDHLSLAQLTTALTNPVSIANAGDGSGRLFIVEQEGIIRIYDLASDTLAATPFLDIRSKVDDDRNEQGLLGLAFHPDFSNNRQFYVYYTRDHGDDPDRSVVAMYRASLADPNIAGTEETVLMEFEQNASNHNGGDLHFGTDGFLYIASGDGGGGDDQYRNAQDLDSLKGKLLRIDVDGTPPGSGELCGIVANYAIPPGNPFTGPNDGCDEILHFGLRNPWRFSFDALTEDMYIADVGQREWEEVNYVPSGSAGVNYGWSCREGMHDFPGDDCISPYTDPVIEYPHTDDDDNCSITGGYVYRGSQLPLRGRYLYGDWCTARIWIATRSANGWSSEEWVGGTSGLSSISSFGQDENCELYLVDRDGKGLYRIVDAEGLFSNGFEQLNCQ